MEVSYQVVDVFTDRPFAGNPLAVVLGAEGVDGSLLQAVAREFNLSETAFPLEPTPQERSRGVDYRVRIFTPSTELPFAGHPSVGTAWVLASLGRVRPGRVVQACGAGDLPLEVAPDGGPVRLTGGTPSLRTAEEAGVDVAAACGAVGLALEDLVGDPAQVRVAGTGIDFVHLLVRPDAVARAVPDVAALVRLGAGLAGTVVASWVGEAVHARVFAADVGVAEDPATGSAALGLGVQAVARGLVAPEGTSSYVVSQGAEAGRPSRLDCVVRASGGVAVEASVAGRVVPVASGRMRLP